MPSFFRSASLILLSLGLLVFAGCSASDGRGGRGRGTAPPPPSTPDAEPPPPGMMDASTPPPPMGTDCAEGARWIYVLDRDGTLRKFQPDTLEFSTIGTLSCPAPAGNTPFSMSVDRDATAWVLYTDGRIYHVSTTDASCTTTAFTPNQAGYENFGMGFVADAAGGSDETLFVAGGSSIGMLIGDSAQLASIDTSSLTLSPVGGTLGGWPELTGTGAGELYGFFPVTSPFSGEVTSVKRLDRSSGNPVETFNLSSLNTNGVSAWAFAFWGGRFYIFVEIDRGGTAVHRFEPDSLVFETVIDNTGYGIVGAGVSTCAPVELI